MILLIALIQLGLTVGVLFIQHRVNVLEDQVDQLLKEQQTK